MPIKVLRERRSAGCTLNGLLVLGVAALGFIPSVLAGQAAQPTRNAPRQKPIFSCISNGQKIEVFARVEPFEPEKHKFELAKKVGMYGFEEWLLDGKRLVGTNDFVRGDGCPMRGAGWRPSDFRSVLSGLEVYWNGKPGVIDGLDSLCLNPSLETDFRSERYFRFSPRPGGKTVFIEFANGDTSGTWWHWQARKDASVPTTALLQFTGKNDERPVLDCTVNEERIEVYFAETKFVRKNHIISRSKVKTGESGETYAKLEVDGRVPSGTDNELSALRSEIARFEVRWNGVAIRITPSLYSDCFNPGYVSCFPAPMASRFLSRYLAATVAVLTERVGYCERMASTQKPMGRLGRGRKESVPVGACLASRAGCALFLRMNIGELIVKTAGTCGGRARIARHRVAVARVAMAFRAGTSPEEMIAMWPSLNLAEIHAAIAYSLANSAEIDADIAAEECAWVQAESPAHVAS